MKLNQAAPDFLPNRFQIEPGARILQTGSPSPAPLANQSGAGARLQRPEKPKYERYRQIKTLLRKADTSTSGRMSLAEPAPSLPYLDENGRVIFSMIVEGVDVDFKVVSASMRKAKDLSRESEDALARRLSLEEERDHQQAEFSSLGARYALLEKELEVRRESAFLMGRQHFLDGQMPVSLAREIRRCASYYWEDDAQRDAWSAGEGVVDFDLEFQRHFQFLSVLASEHIRSREGVGLVGAILRSLEFFPDEMFLQCGVPASQIYIFRAIQKGDFGSLEAQVDDDQDDDLTLPNFQTTFEKRHRGQGGSSPMGGFSESCVSLPSEQMEQVHRWNESFYYVIDDAEDAVDPAERRQRWAAISRAKSRRLAG